jgi:hypothetical protein
VDIVTLLTNNTGPIVGGLVGSATTILAVLITRATMRGSSRKQRTDEYRREVRSAANSVVIAARAFIDAASAFERSVFWFQGTIQTTSGHDERYLAYQEAKVELEQKIADFQSLVDIDVLSKAARTIRFHALLIELAIPEINDASKLSNYPESNFRSDLKDIRKSVEALRKTALPEFRDSVIKYMPHTIVEEHRRRMRILRLFPTIWCWLVKQYHKNLSSSRPKQEPSAEISTPPADEGITPTAGDHTAT